LVGERASRGGAHEKVAGKTGGSELVYLKEHQDSGKSPDEGKRVRTLARAGRLKGTGKPGRGKRATPEGRG